MIGLVILGAVLVACIALMALAMWLAADDDEHDLEDW